MLILLHKYQHFATLIPGQARFASKPPSQTSVAGLLASLSLTFLRQPMQPPPFLGLLDPVHDRAERQLACLMDEFVRLECATRAASFPIPASPSIDPFALLSFAPPRWTLCRQNNLFSGPAPQPLFSRPLPIRDNLFAGRKRLQQLQELATAFVVRHEDYLRTVKRIGTKTP
jgi:hypothetical protein